EQELAALRAAQTHSPETQLDLLLALESAADGFAACDADFRCLHVNAAGERWFARPREALIGRTVWEAVPDCCRAEMEQQCRRVMAVGTPSTFEKYSVPLKKWFEIRIQPSGRGGLCCWFRDITPRKRALEERERVVREAGIEHELLGEVLRNSPVRIAVVRGPGFLYELVNPAYQELAPDKNMVGHPMLEVWAEVADKLRPAVERCLATGQPQHATDAPRLVLPLPADSGDETYVTFSMVPMHGPDG